MNVVCFGFFLTPCAEWPKHEESSFFFSPSLPLFLAHSHNTNKRSRLYCYYNILFVVLHGHRPSIAIQYSLFHCWYIQTRSLSSLYQSKSQQASKQQESFSTIMEQSQFVCTLPPAANRGNRTTRVLPHEEEPFDNNNNMSSSSSGGCLGEEPTTEALLRETEEGALYVMTGHVACDVHVFISLSLSLCL